MSMPTTATWFYFVVILFPILHKTSGYFQSELNKSDFCFCQLKGGIDDCSCNVDTVDHFNNVKIFPRLKSLLVKDYFRFFKVNLNQLCPFWADDSKCAMKHCGVEACQEEDLPVGLKGGKPKLNKVVQQTNSYSEEAQVVGCADLDEELGFLNTSISAAAHKGFEKWAEHDDALDNFCILDEDRVESQYVDLLLNPERYTGYKGPSAHRIWRSIYLENCFRPKNSYSAFIPYGDMSTRNGVCLEARVFYRVVSGVHASINIHLCANFLQSEKNQPGFIAPPTGMWGPNKEEFERRFHPSNTDGEGPHWLRNLYFVYLLELRALQKAAPYLAREDYFTGNDSEDKDVKVAVKDFLSVVDSFPHHFNESTMFVGGAQAAKLKDEFRMHFRNISRIMDCVGCDKCRLWGKLQVQGLGTALKILFSGKFDLLHPLGTDLVDLGRNQFQLKRSEIVSLFNAFGRLSTSINELEMFRNIIIR